MRRVRQKHKNLAKELFNASDEINTLGRQLITPESQDPLTVERLRQLEDELFGVLLIVRQHRHDLSAPQIKAKGQLA